MRNTNNDRSRRGNSARRSGCFSAPLLLAAFLACGQKRPPDLSPAAPASAGGQSDNGNDNDNACDCGEFAELANDTESAFIRDDPCTGLASDHRNVVGVLSRRRGATTVSVLYCDRFDWCFVRIASGRHGFVHGSVLRRDRSTDSPISLDE